jgi:hypothetical protein
MTTKSEILRRLPSFTNDQRLIVKDQGTEDIIEEILKAHKLYKNDYEKICSLFYTGDQVGTAKKVFNYIKNNIKYVIESDNLQLIKAPSAIFAMPSSDCKNYALAINGILDACRREYGMNCDLVYRFAAYDGTRIPQHVFAVMITDDGEEVWIDPVLNTFNEDKAPNYYTDKKVKNMALMAMSGFDPYANNANAQNRSLGQFSLPSPPQLTLAQGTGLNVAPPPRSFSLSNILSSGNISQLVQSSGTGSFLNVASTGLSFLGPAGAGLIILLKTVANLFVKKPNRNDWQGWDGLDSSHNNPAGTQAANWVINDGDSVENEAANILSYITQKNNGLQKILEAANEFFNQKDAGAFLDRIYNKLERGGYGNEARQVKQAVEQALTPPQMLPTTTTDVTPPPPPLATQTAGMSPLIILALVGAGTAIFLRKKK